MQYIRDLLKFLYLLSCIKLHSPIYKSVHCYWFFYLCEILKITSVIKETTQQERPTWCIWKLNISLLLRTAAITNSRVLSVGCDFELFQHEQFNGCHRHNFFQVPWHLHSLISDWSVANSFRFLQEGETSLRLAKITLNVSCSIWCFGALLSHFIDVRLWLFFKKPRDKIPWYFPDLEDIFPRTFREP